MRPVMNINNEDIDTGIHAGSSEASGISWSIGSMPGRNGTVRILELCYQGRKRTAEFPGNRGIFVRAAFEDRADFAWRRANSCRHGTEKPKTCFPPRRRSRLL